MTRETKGNNEQKRTATSDELFEPLGDREADHNQRVFDLAQRLITIHELLTDAMKGYRMRPHAAGRQTATSCAVGYGYIIQDFANVTAQAVYSGSPSAALALLKPLFESFVKMGALMENPTWRWEEIEKLSTAYPKVTARRFHGLEAPFALPKRMDAWVREMEDVVNQFSHGRPPLLNGIAPVGGVHAPRYKVAWMEFALGFAASCLVGAYEVFGTLQDGTSVERALSRVNRGNPLELKRLTEAETQ